MTRFLGRLEIGSSSSDSRGALLAAAGALEGAVDVEEAELEEE